MYVAVAVLSEFKVNPLPEKSVFHLTIVGVLSAVAYWSVVSDAATWGKFKNPPPNELPKSVLYASNWLKYKRSWLLSKSKCCWENWVGVTANTVY